ncbi:TPR domain-containing protein [Photobacterium atrarenae]|uniref:Nitrite reductase n=1 Tax=Photobacterium atrarenae TaxID=865757 RepID=A0ABY5GC12_9GAMM|nr:nitrite reductase [Photobacterium atrarenae]UTV26702.1 nitrite reductase [Photobacterium atrarenae]
MGLGIGIAGLLVLAMAMVGVYSFRGDRKSLRRTGMLSLAVAVISLGGYAWLGQPIPVSASQPSGLAAGDAFHGLSADEINRKRITAIQDKLRGDKQNGELWYALGNAYMVLNEFEHAALTFSYAARLAETPQANIFAAQATAIYYRDGQQLGEEGRRLLGRALMLDPDNLPGLMLQATDYFLTARYEKAIETWQQALDSEHPEMDRVEIIRAIHRAEQLL